MTKNFITRTVGDFASRIGRVGAESGNGVILFFKEFYSVVRDIIKILKERRKEKQSEPKKQ